MSDFNKRFLRLRQSVALSVMHAMREAGIDIAHLATTSGIDKKTLQEILTGDYNGDLSELAMLEEALGCELLVISVSKPERKRGESDEKTEEA